MSIDPTEWRSEDTSDLLDTILALPDRPAAERFFRDLCTLRELHDLAQRWHVVRLLDEGLAYTEILRTTGASTATITRIAQWLNHGTGGYREALARTGAEARPMIATSESRVTAFPGSESGRLRLAIPNKGRMQQPSLQLLHDAGLRFEDGTRALTAKVEGFPLDILFVRTDDIVEFVADGVADLGITGTNLLIESGADLDTLVELGYGYCRLEAAVPNESPARALEDLAGMRLATSHPHATERSFAKRGIEAEIVTVSGAVEVAPTMGLADGVVDLVSSGSTLIMNGLRSVGPLFASQAILVGRKDITPAAAAIMAEVRTMIEAVIAGRGVKYLMMNAPDSALEAIEAILPGLESPSVLPLAHEGMHAVHAVVGANDVHRILVPLREAGATGILVIPVEKLLP